MRGGGVAMRKEAWFGVGFRGTAGDTLRPPSRERRANEPTDDALREDVMIEGQKPANRHS